MAINKDPLSIAVLRGLADKPPEQQTALALKALIELSKEEIPITSATRDSSPDEALITLIGILRLIRPVLDALSSLIVETSSQTSEEILVTSLIQAQNMCRRMDEIRNVKGTSQEHIDSLIELGYKINDLDLIPKVWVTGYIAQEHMDTFSGAIGEVALEIVEAEADVLRDVLETLEEHDE